ncbi:MAG: hypothetical protein ACLPKE_27500 [Streptosporangiaceae bacterium]
MDQPSVPGPRRQVAHHDDPLSSSSASADGTPAMVLCAAAGAH